MRYKMKQVFCEQQQLRHPQSGGAFYAVTTAWYCEELETLVIACSIDWKWEDRVPELSPPQRHLLELPHAALAIRTAVKIADVWYAQLRTQLSEVMDALNTPAIESAEAPA